MDQPHRYCLDCGYILDNLEASACPECGRAFDLSQPDSFSRQGLRERQVRRTLRWNELSRLAFVIQIVLLPAFVYGGLETLFAPLLVLVAVINLVTIYLVAAQLRHHGYAIIVTLIAAGLAPIAAIGLFIVPMLLASDVSREFDRKQPEDAA